MVTVAASARGQRRTVESHAEQLKKKLKLSGRNEVIAWALGRRIEGERS